MKQRITEYKTSFGNKGYIFTYSHKNTNKDLFCIYFADCFTEKSDNEKSFLIQKLHNINILTEVSKNYDMNDFWETFWLGTDEKLDKLTKSVYNKFHDKSSETVTDKGTSTSH